MAGESNPYRTDLLHGPGLFSLGTAIHRHGKTAHAVDCWCDGTAGHNLGCRSRVVEFAGRGRVLSGAG